MAECWVSLGVPACAGAFWMCVACRQAVSLGCGKGGLKVLAILCAAQSGQTTGCVLSLQIGLVSCLSHLHAQLLVSNASRNMQMQCITGLLHYLRVPQRGIDCVFLPCIMQVMLTPDGETPVGCISDLLHPTQQP